tara:strand:- start:1176 stop:1457 length:282 start_codon:yes stop_codon:yes gene_type:complete
MADLNQRYIQDTDPFQYIIFTSSSLTDELKSEIESSCISVFNHARFNVSGTKCIMKYRGSTPDTLKSYTSYSTSELNNIIQTSEWLGDEPEEE